MVYANEVYQWFKELTAHNRIEFTCNLMKLCVPSELRFISTLLEDMNNKDYPSLRDTEDRCNSPSEFSQYTHVQLNSEHVHKLCLSLSLLKPTNQILAQMIYEILRIHFNYACKCFDSHSDIKADLMLLYALASHHPAFAFNCRHKLAEYYTKLSGLYNDDNYVGTNCNNSALKETLFDQCQHILSVCDVIMDGTDAIIIIEMVPQHAKQKFVSRRKCQYSQIKDTISKIFPLDHEFHRTIVTLNKNGSFTNNNIRDIVNKIMRFACYDSSKSEAKMICEFFNNLPLWNNANESINCLQKCEEDEERKDGSATNGKHVGQQHTGRIITQSLTDDILVPVLTAVSEPITITTGINSSITSLPLTPDISFTDHISSNYHDQLSSKKSSTHHDSDIDSNDSGGYLNQNLYPVNMLSMPYNPLIRYYLPNYSFYLPPKGSTSSSSLSSSTCPLTSTSTALESANTTVVSSNDINGKTGPQYYSDSLITNQGTTFVHQSPYQRVQLLCHPISGFYHTNDTPYTSIYSHPSPSFSISNIVTRPQSHHSRQKSSQYFPEPT